MRSRSQTEQNPTRKVAGWVCLLTLLLIYASMASATLLAVTGACCTGDQCPIHGNHHPAREKPAQQSDDPPMNCDHDGHAANKTQSCLISCCHSVEQSVAHSNSFLLTPLSLSTALAPQSLAALMLTAAKLSLVFAPLAPPPKSLAN